MILNRNNFQIDHLSLLYILDTDKNSEGGISSGPAMFTKIKTIQRQKYIL